MWAHFDRVISAIVPHMSPSRGYGLRKCSKVFSKVLILLVAEEGLEPPTRGL